MKLLIEEHRYPVDKVKNILNDIEPLQDYEGFVSISYVGYFYNTAEQDCVFILPKVLLQDVDGQERVFGKYLPEEIIDLDKAKLTQTERDFLYKFAVWVYRAIVVYKDKNRDTDIVRHQNIAQVGRGRRKLSNTFLDIILALFQFNKDNQNFFFFVLKNIHSGMNKINWTRTISTSSAIIQDETPIYIDPVNKRKQINFDEELLVIFFSILNYLGDQYGFPKNINCNFDLITGKRFEHYLKGFGKTRLRQIKYKYFSDKALQLWELCYAFFENARQVYVNANQKEYLLVKNFYIVFEAIIDELIGDKPLPDGMDKKQDDGKIVDHLYTAQSLVSAQEQKKTYYIGDSKYYKIGHELTPESIYKQYTYARNVIQWNLDLFNEHKPTTVQLVDPETEGYNVIPNFFISATMIEGFSYADYIDRTDRKNKRHKKTQFENRLFDRDTLLLFHYDVNFLFVLALYARDRQSEKAAWKKKMRLRFTGEIRDWLQEDYKFYAMQAHPDVDAAKYFKENFQETLGKTFRPFEDQNVFSLALDKNNGEQNEKLLAHLRENFYVVDCPLGTDPGTLIEDKIAEVGTVVSPASEQNGVLMVMMENFENKSQSFLESGHVAVAVPMRENFMEMLENVRKARLILFHVRNDEHKHLFEIESLRVKPASEIPGDVYRTMQDKPIYVDVVFNNTELDSSTYHPLKANAPFTRESRYDAQFATAEALTRPVKNEI